jgi:hypothetical protein
MHDRSGDALELVRSDETIGFARARQLAQNAPT